jgi:hypothetical protein
MAAVEAIREAAEARRFASFLLFGVTASGKTELALEIARRFPVEIVSLDSAQVFIGMDIGTAKPDRETLARFPHHLIDLITPEERYSAAQFRRDALRVMSEIATRGKAPLLVGGTMLYFKALIAGLADLPQADPELRAAIDAEAAHRGWPALHAELAKADPLTAARLALAAIALLWQTPSKALSGFNLLFDRSVRRVKTLTFVPEKHVLSGSSLSHMPHGPRLKPGAWEDLLRDRKDHFAVAGEVLDFILSPTGQVARPTLMNTFAQALMWFHEGCRETVSLMAIVKFTASMDALAGGHGEPAICRVITARLGLKPPDPIRRNGPTLSEAIKKIYGDGRSRTVHGTNDKFGWDWTDTKGSAEQFARLCLISCMDWAAQNTTADDPALLQK